MHKDNFSSDCIQQDNVYHCRYKRLSLNMGTHAEPNKIRLTETCYNRYETTSYRFYGWILIECLILFVCTSYLWHRTVFYQLTWLLNFFNHHILLLLFLNLFAVYNWNALLGTQTLCRTQMCVWTEHTYDEFISLCLEIYTLHFSICHGCYRLLWRESNVLAVLFVL